MVLKVIFKLAYVWLGLPEDGVDHICMTNAPGKEKGCERVSGGKGQDSSVPRTFAFCI